METIKLIITVCLGWTAGLFFQALLISQLMLILFVSVKITRKAKRAGLKCRYNELYGIITGQCAMWIIIPTAVILLVVFFTQKEFIYTFFAATAFGFLKSIKSYTINPDNVSDYLKSYSRYYDEDPELIALTAYIDIKKDDGGNSTSGLLALTRILSALSILLMVVLVFVCLTYDKELDSRKYEIDALKEANAQLAGQMSTLSVYDSEDIYETASTTTRELRDYVQLNKELCGIGSTQYDTTAGDFLTQTACIITPSSEMYHQLFCSQLHDMRDYAILNISAAKAYGYKACPDCY